MKAVFARVLFGIALLHFFWASSYAQCTSGCTQTITLSSPSQTISYAATADNQVLCIVKDAGLVGNAMVTSGTLDLSGFTNQTICVGPGVILGTPVSIQNPGAVLAIQNYGDLQDTIRLSQPGHSLQNYGNVFGVIEQAAGTVTNQSGALIKPLDYALNGGGFVNNTGANFIDQGDFTLKTGATYSGAGGFNVSGDFTAESGSASIIGGAANISGSFFNYRPLTFSSGLSVGGLFSTYSGSSTNVTGALSVTGAGEIRSTVTATGLATFQAGLQNLGGGNATFSGGLYVFGTWQNSATVTFAGSVLCSGTVTNNVGAIITSASTSCKSLCAPSIANSGTISSTAGPRIRVCSMPVGGTQTNLTLDVIPTAAPSGLSLTVNNLIVSGSFTPASPAPVAYLLLRKPTPFTGADLPVNGNSYAVGNTIGGATVAAILSGGVSSFNHTNTVCGDFYYAVVSASNNVITCGTYFTSSYASSGPVTTNVSTVAISYSQSAFCRSVGSNQGVTLVGGITGGTFSASPSGLTLNTGNGAVLPSTSTAGSYTITYAKAAAGSCPAVSISTTLGISDVNTATLSYAGSPFCTTLSSVLPTFSGTAGGTFSATAGLTIDAVTGEINPSTSTAGAKTITYALAANGACPALNRTASVTITTSPSTATIAYNTAPFCRNNAFAQPVTRTGVLGGTFSASPAGLNLNPSNGAIIPASSTAGSYTVTLSYAAGGGCAAFSTTADVVVGTPNAATISYTGNPFCSTVGSVAVNQTGTTGGTYSASTPGLELDPVTGAINPSLSTPGVRTVTYTMPANGGCPAVNATASVTVTGDPTSTISYSGTPFCRSLGTPQAVSLTGVSGGTFTSAPAGLIVNSTSGDISPSSSQAGTYTVTYTIPAAGGCPLMVTTTPVTITPLPTIVYSGSPWCVSTGVQSVTQTGLAGGTYSSSPAGLTIDPNTGQITPSASTPGTYTVSYAYDAHNGCPASVATTTVTINTTPVISYPGSPLCRTSAAEPVTLTGTTGGTFSSTAGLAIAAINGTITPGSSTPGTYIVTYTYPASGGCPAGSTTASVSITSLPTISYAGSPWCVNASTKTVTQTGVAGGTYSISPVTGLGINTSNGTLDPAGATAGTYTITYSYPAFLGCPASTTTTNVTIAPLPSMTSSATTTICGGNAVSLNLAANPASTFSWVASDNAQVTGESLTPQSGSQITDVLVNASGSNQVVTYSVTPTSTANSCVGTSQTVSVTVLALPQVLTTTNPAYCAPSGVSSSYALPTGTVSAGAVLEWFQNPTGGSPLTLTPVIAAGSSVTVYAQARNTTTGCISATRTPATVTVNLAPNAVVVSGTTPACSTTTLTATGGTNGTIYWQNTTNNGTSTALEAGSMIVTSSGTYYFRAQAPNGCWGVQGSRTVVINPLPAIPSATNGARCGPGTVSIAATPPGGSTVDWYADPTGGSPLASGSTTFTTPSISITTVYYAESRNTTTGCISATRRAVTATVNSFPVVNAITGPQNACVGGTATFANTTGGGVWSSANTGIATVNSSGVITGVSAGTTNINYTVTGAGGCQTVVSRSVTIWSTAPGTPDVYGNGFWNVYVYNTNSYTGYSGFYTTGSALGYSTLTDFANNVPASTAPGYQGCQVPQNTQSLRLQRTNFTPGAYQLDMVYNDDGVEVLVDGQLAYSSGTNFSSRTNVWTGTLSTATQLEIRVNNSGTGAFQLTFNLTPVTATPALPGVINGDQIACASQTPNTVLGSVTAPTAGTCTNRTPTVQWESSIDNITFAPISGANGNTYTIPAPLSQTTYYRRAYRNWCETVYSNTVTVTVYPGPMGDPTVAGNGNWRAYVYNQTDFATGYTGFFATDAGLSQNSETYFLRNVAPHNATGYQGCYLGAVSPYSVRFRRTNFPTGTYRFDMVYNDDLADIILNGVTVYSTGTNFSSRTNVWTGTITPSDVVEIRYNNTGGPGNIQWNMYTVPFVAANPGVINGTQSICPGSIPLTPLGNVTAGTQGACTNKTPLYQWEISTDNITFTPIAGANATSYNIPSELSTTTYYRRGYNTWCGTEYSNTVTVSVPTSPPGTPGVFGDGTWNAYVYNSTDFASNYSGYYTTGSALTYNSTTDFGSSARPSLAPTYLGCQLSTTFYSIRYQRTNFPLGIYQIGIPINDDYMEIIVDGVVVYSRWYDPNPRTNVWTGTLRPTSQVEIRYFNNAGPGQIHFTFTLVPLSVPALGGTISGDQGICLGNIPNRSFTTLSPGTAGTCNQALPLPYQWQMSTDNVTYTDIPSANALSYTHLSSLTQNTWFRRAYRTFCDTVYSNAALVTIYNTPPGTPGVAGNGNWIGYVYGTSNYNNYAGFFTTGSAVNYNTVSDFASGAAPSTHPTYNGCQVLVAPYSIRLIRTNIPYGLYSIGISRNDDVLELYIDGSLVYTSGYSTTDRPAVWTGTIYPSITVELRYNNTGGPGELNFYFSPASLITASTPGTISGVNSICGNLSNVTLGTNGNCSAMATPYQWQSSTDSLVFTNIPGANSSSYLIPVALTQTTFYRRLYRSYCDTVASNVVKVEVYTGVVQGTPGGFGNGLWNAYVYNATDYATAYSGYYTTGSSLSYNTTTDFAAAAAPSSASTYLGCVVSNTQYSVRFQRTNFTPGIYQIGVNRNDNNMVILLDGVQIYTSGTNGGVRSNVWTGTLKANSQLEIRYNNTGGNGDISWTITPTTLSVPALAGTISGNQSMCSGQIPQFVFGTVSTGTAGTCSAVGSPYQWQSSTDNITFTNISGANATTFQQTTPLITTTYFRRAYRTFCDTVFSNVVTATVYNSAPGTPGVYGDGLWNGYVYRGAGYSQYAGFFTTGSALNYNTTTDYPGNQAPSFAATYQGCLASANFNGVRLMRTNIPAGLYSIGMNYNDDAAEVLINGTVVYSRAGADGSDRPAVWTGYIQPSTQVEIRYFNSGGWGQLSFYFTLLSTFTPSNPGVIAGNQSVCTGQTPPIQLTSVTPGSAATCPVRPTAYQWQSSTDNVTFTNISGANIATYLIFGTLPQTTYFRRLYMTYCDTSISNVVTVSVVNGAQGTPGVFGNGFWNAYVYNQTNFSSGYSGYFTTPSALGFNTTTLYAANQPPSYASTYLGCQINPSNYSVRFQRTGFTAGTYQISVTRNDDNMDVILDGVTVYTSAGGNGGLRPNVWTGNLFPTSQLEIRYANVTGSGDLNFDIVPTSLSVGSTAGIIAGGQTFCSGQVVARPFTSTTAGTAGTCSQGLPTFYQWQISTDNVTFSNIAGATAVTYTHNLALTQTTYFRRAYLTFCDTVYSNVLTATMVAGPVGPEGVAGNGVWNAYVYGATNFTSNYSGYFTTDAALNQNSTTYYAAAQPPSFAPNYQGCQIAATNYSVRFIRTGIPAGLYNIGILRNDDNIQILIDGVVAHTTAGANGTDRPTAWVGMIYPSTTVEIRYLNGGGPGDCNFYFTPATLTVASTPGTIAGNQVLCTGQIPALTMSSTAAGTAGTCTQVSSATTATYQWQVSTDNVVFTNIAGANLATYTPGFALTATSYFRRAYRTYCDTVFSNVVTATVFGGPQGTPGVFGNGVWNAYVYDATDFASNYSGYYTTASGLTYNSTTDFSTNMAPSLAPNYQGCQVNANVYSVRYQRTGFTNGVYQIGVNRNDNNMTIILNGVTLYSIGASGTARPSVWVGRLGPSSQLEIRYNNTSGNGDISWTFTTLSTVTNLLPGSISGDQTICSVTAPSAITSVSTATAGTCTLVPNPYQWESSTNNLTFTAIPGANAVSYTPGLLSQTTYFRRAYRSYCDTVYTNVVTKTITPNPAATITYDGSPFCRSLTTAQPVNRTGSAGGTFTSSLGLSINSSSGAITPSTSTAGSYVVTYSIPAGGGCSAFSTTTTVSLTTPPSATISYSGMPWCTTLGIQNVNFSGNIGGTFSSTAGLSINASNGQINPGLSTGGAYTVTYTLPAAGGCAAFSTTTPVSLTQAPNATIAYSGSPFCVTSGGSQAVTITGNTGGTFSATPSGLVLDANTGAVQPGTSSPNTYTITYALPAAAGCAAYSTTTTVQNLLNVGSLGAITGLVNACQNPGALSFSTSAPNATSYTWSVTGTGNSISGTGATASLSLDPAFIGTAVISVTANGCGGTSGPSSTNLSVYPSGTWLGISTNWNATPNWCGGIPTISTDVLIPTTATNMPIVSVNSFVNNLTLQTGASVTVAAGRELRIAGDLTGPGALLPEPASTVNYAGLNPQTIYPANYGNLITTGAGPFTWPSSTVRISGSLITGSTPQVTTGSTIEFNGTSAQNIPPFTFNNLIVSGNSTKTQTGNVLVGGNLNLSAGTLALNGNTLELAGTVSGIGSLAATCLSTLTISGGGATGTLRFASGARTLGTLNVTKASAGTMQLGSSLDICTNLNLGMGHILLGSNNLTLLSGATANAGSTDSYVQTLDQMSPTGAGFFIREVPVGSGPQEFPVGTAGSYTPAFIDNIGFSRNFKVRAFNDVFEHGIAGGQIINLDYAVRKTWEIEPVGAGGTPNVTIKLQWNPADEGVNFPTNRLADKIYMGKNSGIGASLWERLITDDQNLTSAPYTLTCGRITSFSKFAVGSDEQPLPVVLGQLAGIHAKSGNQLGWTTYSETESKYFEVQRSEDGNQFRTVGQVQAAGNSTDLRHYAFEDKGARPGMYYRLRMVGQQADDIAFSNTIRISGAENVAVELFPVPARDYLRVRLAGAAQEFQLQLFDLQGRELSIAPRNLGPGEAEIPMDGLPQGVYRLEIRMEDGTTSTRQILKQ